MDVFSKMTKRLYIYIYIINSASSGQTLNPRRDSDDFPSTRRRWAATLRTFLKRRWRSAVGAPSVGESFWSRIAWRRAAPLFSITSWSAFSRLNPVEPFFSSPSLTPSHTMTAFWGKWWGFVSLWHFIKHLLITCSIETGL